MRSLRYLQTADWQPLAEYLERQPAALVTLRLAEIEALLGRPLPPSVVTQRWWMRGAPREGYRRLLTPLGWTVRTVDMRYGVQSVTFVKMDASGEATP